MDIIEDAVEGNLDVIENTVERVVTVTRNNPWMFVGGLVVGAAIGGFAAYKYLGRTLTLQYEERLTEELETSRAFYARINKQGEFSTPESAVETLVPTPVAEALVNYQGGSSGKVAYNKPEEIVVTSPIEDPRPPIRTTVFEDPRDWDYDAELKLREENPTKPFVISTEEFTENPDNHEQITLTYFAGDNTLADLADGLVDNPDYIVGEDNLARFGAGSHDNNVVYVRNPRISADYEILLSTGRYQVEVLGNEVEEPVVRHSEFRHGNRIQERPGLRRFRDRDE